MSLSEVSANNKINWHKEKDEKKQLKSFANTVIAARYHRGNRNMLMQGTYINS
jgi:hypothetical protein